MICYRDRTFCTANCATPDCDIRLTEQVQLDARRWWGGDGAPISVQDCSGTCPEYAAPALLERNDRFKYLYPE